MDDEEIVSIKDKNRNISIEYDEEL